MTKVLILSTSDLNGGAARAAYRLHQGLLKIGVDSQMLVQTKISDDSTVIGPVNKLQKGLATIRPTLDTLPLRFYHRQEKPYFYSFSWLPERLLPKIRQLDPDVINLHWICGGYLRLETIAKLNKPIVWTLHDMWAFTGGCHYSQGCDRYQQACGACPQLNSDRDWDLSRWVWQRKAKAWQQLDLTIVTPSQWLRTCVRSSSLLQNYPIKVIPNGIEPQIYKPIEQSLVRNILGLPLNQKIVLFGAVSATGDRRKGFHLLLPALQQLTQLLKSEAIELVVFGASQPLNPPDFGLRTRYLGRLNDDISLSLIYAAADVFVAPSLQDNLPNTVMEALACGTPCVAFDVGGMSDMISHRQNGYLAQPGAIEDLAQGIAWVLQDQERSRRLRQQARDTVENRLIQTRQAQLYQRLFAAISEIK